MDTECIQCPPITYQSHTLCHTQFYEFQNLCQQLEENKENINPYFLDKLKQWKLALNSLFYLSSTDQQYFSYGERLKEFNGVFSLILQGKVEYGSAHR